MWDVARSKNLLGSYQQKKRKCKKHNSITNIQVTIINSGEKIPQHRKAQLKQYSKKMQHRPTVHEIILYSALRQRFPYLKIKTQVVFNIDKGTAYIVDIYIVKRKIAIEVDGPLHDGQKQYDLIRDELLFSCFGVRTYRFKNQDVQDKLLFILNNIRAILDKEQVVKTPPVRHPKYELSFKSQPEVVDYIDVRPRPKAM